MRIKRLCMAFCVALMAVCFMLAGAVVVFAEDGETV